MSASVISKRTAGVKCFVHEIVVNAAVELVRPRLHGHVEQTTARLAEFRSEVAGLDRDLLNGFDALLCLCDLTVADRSSSVLTVDPQRRTVPFHSIYTNRLIR